MNKVATVLLLIFCLVCSSFSAGAIKAKGGGSDSETSSTDSSSRDTGAIENQESIDFSGDAPDNNLFDQDEVRGFANKGLVNWASQVSDLPTGKTYKVLSKNGWTDENDGSLKEKGWSQIINDCVASDNFFEFETDRVAFLRENDDFNAGKPNDLPIHRKQLLRLLAYAASSDGIELSDQARIPVPLGSMYWENSGAGYNIPMFLALSYKSAEEGIFISPALDRIGFEINVVEPPYEIVDWTADFFGWYFQEHVD